MDCKNLLHPFQHDPGISQRQRIIDDLLSGSAKIDGRSLADLLNFFEELSWQINYYHADLTISNWRTFFRKSTPFALAAIIKYDSRLIKDKLALYNKLFDKHPSASGLQLVIHYMFYSVIDKINTWHLTVKGTGLPIEQVLEQLIKDKLHLPVKQFIGSTNAAVKWYCIKAVDARRLYDNEVWKLEFTDLFTIDESFTEKGNTKRERIIALRDAINQLLPAFMEVIRVIRQSAEMSIEQSLIPLKEELQKKHPPQLAIMFAFLKIFQYLQNDLNSFTKKHLDFFYKQVLQLKARSATPDKAHILFEIQKQLDSYKLEKGLEVKDGKDNNKAEVLFALDDEIVVNKAQVADKRTLFLNSQTFYKTTYLEGVYIAPKADKADGLEKDFKENQPKSFATLGARYSKYKDPEHQFIKPYPNARLGFILASPVLLLNEGKRTITIHLSCQLKEDICKDTKVLISPASSCCEEDEQGISTGNGSKYLDYPDFFSDSSWLYNEVLTILDETYYYLNLDLINQAQKKGVGSKLTDRLKGLLTTTREICYCATEEVKNEAVVLGDDFEKEFDDDEIKILSPFFAPRRALNVLFSGEEEWLAPKAPAMLSLLPKPADPISGNKQFTLKIETTFEADQPAITFYNKETLKEDLDTSLPLVKIELDDKIKLWRDVSKPVGESCCLTKEPESEQAPVSLYHFFRNVIVTEEGGDKTTIDVKVCGLKNFIVQNDESVQDVNNPVYPFGTGPKVGSSFYIGSKEIFSKNWQELWVNVSWKDKPENLQEHYKFYSYEAFEDGSTEITEESFKVKSALLEQGQWKENGQVRLFKEPGATTAPFCNHPHLDWYQDVYYYQGTDFNNQTYEPDKLSQTDLLPYNVNSRYGFLRLTLDGVSFQHDRYSFVLARHMMALAGLIDPVSLVELKSLIEQASRLTNEIHERIQQIILALQVIENSISNTDSRLTALGVLFNELDNALAANQIGTAQTKVNEIKDIIGFPPDPDSLVSDLNIISDKVSNIKNAANLDFDNNPDTINIDNDGILQLVTGLVEVINKIDNIVNFDPDDIGLPKEPYTPIIKEISFDYTATATITDIDLIHLYPYEGTYKKEELEQTPSLLPSFCDEGTLFLGLKDLVPGSNVNILFQLAEATADSEAEKEEVHWFYLENNQWKMLRPGFEVLDDATRGLTSSGIIKFALPANMSSENTILPRGLHWIKAAIPANSRSVSDTLGIHTQAVQATFTNQEENDKLRLGKDLQAGSIAKLKEADASVKKVNQPYDSFGGRIPEEEGAFYVRVSELLRHKDRAIQKFDYERLALEAFPQLFKVKCINHSFALNAHQYINDFPVAPGYVLLAVIPDLNKLKADQSFEPRVPVSLLEEVAAYLRQRTSPFVRLRVMNPRYEKVHFCLKVRFYKGRDLNYYQQKLKQDLREFMAPWAVGIYDKFSFGQCIYRSDLIRFLESRDYLDFILELKYRHEADEGPFKDGEKEPVCPKTPRSILVAGEIDVCIPEEDCMEDETREREACDHKKYLFTDFF